MADDSSTCSWPSHVDVRNPVLVGRLADRLEAKGGVERLQVGLGCELHWEVWPPLGAGGEAAAYDLPAEAGAAVRWRHDDPTDAYDVILLEEPADRSEAVGRGREEMTRRGQQVEPVDVEVGALLLDDEDEVAELEYVVELDCGEVGCGEVGPSGHPYI